MWNNPIHFFFCKAVIHLPIQKRPELGADGGWASFWAFHLSIPSGHNSFFCHKWKQIMKALGQILVFKLYHFYSSTCIMAHLQPFIATVSYGNITAFVINLKRFLSVFTNISICLGSGYIQFVDIQLSWQNDGSFRPWNLASWICLDRLKSLVSSRSYKWRWEKEISFHTQFSWVLSRWYDQYQAKDLISFKFILFSFSWLTTVNTKLFIVNLPIHFCC